MGICIHLIGDDNAIKIIDLGLGYAHDHENSEILAFGGVTFYLPPERINISSVKKHAKKPDFFSDVYQIGLLMYLVLYNSLPFSGFIWEELAQNIKEKEINYPGRTFHNFKVPLPLIDIIKKCLSKNPEHRYRNASVILRDYKKYVFKQQKAFIN